MRHEGYLTNLYATMRMLTEAQAVISYRMMGMAGMWPVARSEVWRMSLEKGPIFAAASQAAWAAAIAGQSPDKVAAAWLQPISGRTRSNQRRLSRRR
ncbi:antifreeze protein [Palleronia sp.]|uniref:antifreeze protein n=1 Tax=Palleronia sp. TaxID=1940284 RepID=UPI0035C7B9D3